MASIEESLNSKRIPQKRGNKHIKARIIIALLSLTVAFLFTGSSSENIWLFVYSLLTAIVVFFIIAVFIRICLFFEELEHLESRYKNSYSQLFHDHFSILPLVVGIGSILLLLLMHSYCKKTIWESEAAILVLLSFIVCSMVLPLLGFGKCVAKEKTDIEKLNGLDYGSGMAYSFFYGYLKFMLPKTGGAEKGLRELQEDYEAKNGVKFATYKLFILIPLSLYCPSSLENDFSPKVETSATLESIVLNVAGVRERVYKNSVYKIKVPGKKLYVSAEYATPLRTLNEVVKHNSLHSNRYKEHKAELVLQFYETLSDILRNNPDCKDLCELIFYDDVDPATGVHYDVGDLIIHKLKEIEERNSSLKKN